MLIKRKGGNVGIYTERLLEMVFTIHYDPELPNKFEIRLIGPGALAIDNLRDSKSQDICGFGETVEEAAQEALQKKLGSWFNLSFSETKKQVIQEPEKDLEFFSKF